MILDDFKELIKKGNIGFYNSFEVTEFLLIEKKEKIIYKLYPLVVFEEKVF